jgi:hypothetical protein
MEVFIIILILVILYFVITKANKKPAYLKGGNQKTQEVQVKDTSDKISNELTRSKKSYKYEFLVRGWSNTNVTAKKDDKIMLFPQLNNQHDKHAITAFNNEGFIGFVAKEENSGLYKYLIKDGSYFSQVHWTNDDRPKRYLIDVYATESIQPNRQELRNPELKQKKAEINKKYKLKDKVSDEQRVILLSFFGNLDDEIEVQDTDPADELSNIILDLIICLEEENNSDLSEELFDLIIDYLPETEILIKKKGLNRNNKQVAKKLKDKLEEVLMQIGKKCDSA